MTSSLGYFDQLLPGVDAVRIEVARVDSMFKLSLEQPADIRSRVAAAFAASESRPHGWMAAMIRKAGD